MSKPSPRLRLLNRFLVFSLFFFFIPFTNLKSWFIKSAFNYTGRPVQLFFSQPGTPIQIQAGQSKPEIYLPCPRETDPFTTLFNTSGEKTCVNNYLLVTVGTKDDVEPLPLFYIVCEGMYQAKEDGSCKDSGAKFFLPGTFFCRSWWRWQERNPQLLCTSIDPKNLSGGWSESDKKLGNLIISETEEGVRLHVQWVEKGLKFYWKRIRQGGFFR